MPKKVKKIFGENPEVVAVLSTQVAFDANGDAEVEDEIAEVLAQIPGYEVETNVAPSEDYEIVQEDSEPIEEPEEPSEEDEEEEVEAPSEEVEVEEAPKPKRPARKAPAKRG